MSQPSLSTANALLITKEIDPKLIMEFATKQGANPNQQMIELAIRTEVLDVRVAKLNGVILGMRVFQRMVNPMRGELGYALLEDWSNGVVGLDPVNPS